MKTHLPPLDSSADEQASLWAARIDGDTLDRAQRAELDAWLAQHPSHRGLLSRYCQFSADLEEQIPALVSAGAIAPPARPPAPSALRSWWTLPRLSAAALAAAAVIAVTFVVVRPSVTVENFATAPLQRQTHTLADGTRIELNAQTSLRFENSAHERRVRLAGGEALFMVAKDASRPFIVETPEGLVRVTGTTFNVRTDTSVSTLEVTVVEGSVQVRPGEGDGSLASGPVALTAGDRFTSRGGKSVKVALAGSELDDMLAWRQGQVVFNATPLREAASRFARYHGRAIYVSPAVADETIGGQHSIDDLTGFLTSLEQLLEVKTTLDYTTGAVSILPRSAR